MSLPTLVPVSLFLVLHTGSAYYLDRSPLRWWSQLPEEGEQEMQVVYLPALLPREAQVTAADRPTHDEPVPYNFDAFGRSFKLQLVPNRALVSRHFRVWTDGEQEPGLSQGDASCHFQHAGAGAVAALSACRDHALHGLIVVENSTYELHPLIQGEARTDDASLMGGKTAHVIRRARMAATTDDDVIGIRPRPRRPRRRNFHNKPLTPRNYTVEVALFLDEAAYKIFSPLFDYNEADLRDMLLAYINGVQALYQHSSLGTHIQFSLVRLTLLRSQPAALPSHAERGRLLDAFCAYQKDLNVLDDDDPQHWDMALLLTGLDLYSVEAGRRSGVTMGLAPVGGVCLAAHACVVAEFGATDATQRPYPSAGFTSLYILAHEIGHNLGMHHDGVGNSCARDGYIMSPSRGSSGEATWSACSASALAHLDWASCLLDGAESQPPAPLHHEKFANAPGAVWGAKRQCEILLRDADAAPAASGHGDVCVQLACRSPHRSGLYHAGPALPGTPCHHRKWCQGGECVESTAAASPAASITAASSSSNGVGSAGVNSNGIGSNGVGSTGVNSNDIDSAGVGSAQGWAAWRVGECRSGCTLGSKGAAERRRTCHSNDLCNGTSYDVVLCDDTKVCGGEGGRASAPQLAARACAGYARRRAAPRARAPGLQAPHDPTRMWMGCAIFCQRASGAGYYAPRVELMAAGLDPYFPDGTWCHHDGHQHYYCLQHHCLPENFKLTAQYHVGELPSEDIGGAQNARARAAPEDVETAIQSYLSLDRDGLPITRGAFAPVIPDEDEANWEDNDYYEISPKKTRQSKSL